MRTVPTAALVCFALSAPSLAQTWTEFAYSPLPPYEAQVTRDFDNYSGPDVLVIAQSPDGTTRTGVLFEDAPAGTYSAGRTVWEGLPPVDQLIACDLDADGDEDVVATHVATGRVVLGLNRGDGSFESPVTLAAIGGGQSNLHPVPRCFDREGDGDLDLYFVGRGSAAAHGVWWVEQTAPATFAVPALLTPAQQPAAAFDVGDFDGDGDGDVVASLPGMGLAYFRDDGGATLAAPSVFSSVPSDGNLPDVRFLDVDRDGRIDVVAPMGAARIHVQWFRNTGPGGLAYGGPVAELLDPIVELEIGDLDGDGFDDIAFEQASRRCQAVLSRPGGAFTPRFRLVAGIVETVELELVDMDFDGDLDAVFTGIRSSSAPGITDVGYTPNEGSNFVGLEFGTLLPVYAFNFEARALALADVTGDGALDVLVGSWDLSRSLVALDNGGDASFRRGFEVPIEFSLVSAIDGADFDGDGLADIVALSEDDGVLTAHRSLGEGAFDSGQLVAQQIVDFDVTDYDFDGDPDLLVIEIGATTRELSLYTNDGNGSFSSAGVLAVSPAGSTLRRVTAADVDLDGDTDLLVRATSSNGSLLMVYEATGSGSYAPPIVITPQPSPGDADEFEVADLDGDGDLDVVAIVHFAGGDEVQVIALDASGYGTPTTIDVAPADINLQALVAFDRDLDGRVDVMTTATALDVSRSEIRTSLNSGGGAFAPATVWPSRAIGLDVIAHGDVDLDGDADLVTTRFLYGGGTPRHYTWFASDTTSSYGEPYCVEPVQNSTGLAGRMTVVGTPVLQDDEARLRAWNLPLSSTGLFLTSRTPSVATNIPGSLGILCLGGAIGRFTGPGQIQNTGSTGTMTLDLDLLDLPDPALGSVAVLAGERWYFQGWTRDVFLGIPTSNFTEATSAVWQ